MGLEAPGAHDRDSVPQLDCLRSTTDSLFVSMNFTNYYHSTFPQFYYFCKINNIMLLPNCMYNAYYFCLILISDFFSILSYLVSTEEGHIHKCSVSYNEQFLESYNAHSVSHLTHAWFTIWSVACSMSMRRKIN